MSLQKMTCIVCPRGCQLEVDAEAGVVTGNSCPRGAAHGLAEAVNPVRTITTTVCVVDQNDSQIAVAPVRTLRPIPKKLMFDAMREINALRVHLPIRRGDVLISNILESDADVVATQDLK